jgi:hypothetical protein
VFGSFQLYSNLRVTHYSEDKFQIQVGSELHIVSVDKISQLDREIGGGYYNVNDINIEFSFWPLNHPYNLSKKKKAKYKPFTSPFKIVFGYYYLDYSYSKILSESTEKLNYNLIYTAHSLYGGFIFDLYRKYDLQGSVFLTLSG